MRYSADQSQDIALLRLVSSPLHANNRTVKANHDAESRLLSQDELISCQSPQTRVLVVDDDESIRDILTSILLRHNYTVNTVASAEEALESLSRSSYDLVICDMMMSGMSGLELTNLIRRSKPGLPVILITGLYDTALMRSALRQGASDFIPKPFNVNSIPIIIERNLERAVLSQMQMNHYREAATLSNVHLLAATIDAKEPFTAQHSRRVARIAVAIARLLDLTEAEQQLTDWAAQVHDVGKIGTPDSILLKPGSLSDAEWQIVRQHPLKGEEIVGRIDDLKQVAGIVRWHHERVDGTGYPDGLSGNAIPMEARVISVADAFEVMTSERVYQPRLSRDVAMNRLLASSGTQFDVAVVHAAASLPPEMLV